MAELVFYYGPMGSAKTANALIGHYNALKLGRKVWLIKPAVDNRDDKIVTDGSRITMIRSRLGIEAQAEAISLQDHIQPPADTDLIIFDEAQFLQSWQVDELNAIAKTFNIPVLCYGLRTDFRTNFFVGSSRLFEVADRLYELETVCACGKKAIFTAKFVESRIVTTGDQIDIGGDERYQAVCYACYHQAIQELSSSKNFSISAKEGNNQPQLKDQSYLDLSMIYPSCGECSSRVEEDCINCPKYSEALNKDRTQ